MHNIKKELKKDGMLLKKIPNKDRSESLCRIAINQNPKALGAVPARLQSIELCKYALKRDPFTLSLICSSKQNEELYIYAVKQDYHVLSIIPRSCRTENVLRAALSKHIEALEYVPEVMRTVIFPKASESLINRCLVWLKSNIYASSFIPECVRSDDRILQLQRQMEHLCVVKSKYVADSKQFLVTVAFWRLLNMKTHDKIPEYTVDKYFDSFELYYDYLEGNLAGADLWYYDFEGIDLKKYNYSGALINSKILVSQGLYDGSFYEQLINTSSSVEVIDNNELVIRADKVYLKPVEDEGHGRLNFNEITVFYVSDIHLTHRIVNRFKERATKEEIFAFVRSLAAHLVYSRGTEQFNSFLLIAGDTSSSFTLLEVFYKELIRHWKAERIVVVSGNHELWDPNISLEDNIEHQRGFYKKLGISFLHNDVLAINDNEFDFSIHGNNGMVRIPGEDLICIEDEELRRRLCRCPFIIMGGIGFSYHNPDYNASNVNYGRSFTAVSEDEARTLEMKESSKIEGIYEKLSRSVPNSKVIVLTHMRKEDWTLKPYIPGWIYVNGHNHRDYYCISDDKTIYADNQIGYKGRTVGLKHFYLSNQYDIFSEYKDGEYLITVDQYRDFNRGKRILCTFNTENVKIRMLKIKGYYMFFYYGKFSLSSRRNSLFLLNGGRKQKIGDNNDISFYMSNMEKYANNVRALLNRYEGAQRRISAFIKRLGGSGRIHGCIIDVEKPTMFGYSYYHLYLNPIDGKVTPYFATDIQSRIVYRDLKTMLQNSRACNDLLEMYNMIESNNPDMLPALNYSNELSEWSQDDTVFDEGGYLYRYSRIIRSLQYCTENNVIRIWNSNLLEQNNVDRILKSSSYEQLVDDRLIIDGIDH